MFGIGIGELVVIFVVIFLLFGPKALPDIARGLGEAVRLLKKEINKINEEIPKEDHPAAKDSDGTKVKK